MPNINELQDEGRGTSSPGSSRDRSGHLLYDVQEEARVEGDTERGTEGANEGGASGQEGIPDRGNRQGGRRNSGSKALGDFIFAIHILIFVSLITLPFVGDDKTTTITLLLLLSILAHWILNNNVCFLTLVEKYVRGTPDDEQTFFGRLFGGVYTFGKDEKVSWLVIIGLIIICYARSRHYIQHLIQEVRQILATQTVKTQF